MMETTFQTELGQLLDTMCDNLEISDITIPPALTPTLTLILTPTLNLTLTPAPIPTPNPNLNLNPNQVRQPRDFRL